MEKFATISTSVKTTRAKTEAFVSTNQVVINAVVPTVSQGLILTENVMTLTSVNPVQPALQKLHAKIKSEVTLAPVTKASKVIPKKSATILTSAKSIRAYAQEFLFVKILMEIINAIVPMVTQVQLLIVETLTNVPIERKKFVVTVQQFVKTNQELLNVHVQKATNGSTAKTVKQVNALISTSVLR